MMIRTALFAALAAAPIAAGAATPVEQATAANAQPALAIAAAPSAAPMRALTLAPNTEIVVTPNDDLTTKSMREGAKFDMTTVLDVMQDGVVVIPRGTPGQGTVVYRTGTGAFGKSGKMEVEFNWLDLNGQRIPLAGKFRQEGEGNTGAAVGAVVAVGVFGAFVKGHSAKIVNGQQLRAHTLSALSFQVPGDAPRVVQATMMPNAVAAPAATLVATPTRK